MRSSYFYPNNRIETYDKHTHKATNINIRYFWNKHVFPFPCYKTVKWYVYNKSINNCAGILCCFFLPLLPFSFFLFFFEMNEWFMKMEIKKFCDGAKREKKELLISEEFCNFDVVLCLLTLRCQHIWSQTTLAWGNVFSSLKITCLCKKKNELSLLITFRKYYQFGITT